VTPSTLAIGSLLLALLMAPLVLATHVVVQKTSRRRTLVWLGLLIGLMALSTGLAAVSLVLSAR
jgi:Ni/Fe-hydrogenase subunit HybB-like protein